MTTEAAAPLRLLTTEARPPSLDAVGLIGLVESAGLTGRGGAAFPTGRKLAALARRRPVIVGNAMEGEFLSHKDHVLLTHNPGLVVAGLRLVAGALRARRVILAVGDRIDPGPAREAARGTTVEVLHLDGGFVAGQESALVNRINGRPGVPSDPLVPVRRRGVDDRPTLVLNAETLAQLAMVAAQGPEWFRSHGPAEDPGTFLVSVTGSSGDVVGRPGVLEVPRGTPLRRVLGDARVREELVGGVLVGGYHGAWVPRDALDTPLSAAGLAPYDAAPGAGVVHVLDARQCPLSVAADIATYLAAESAGQCGPCINGLPRMAQTLATIAVPGADPRLVGEVDRLRRITAGRGACRHPDGTGRFVGSTMRVFADHVQAHLAGRCDARPR